MNRILWRSLTAVFFLSVCISEVYAISLGQVDSFEDGTTLNWHIGENGADISPKPMASGGPGGADDGYLRIIADGEGAAGKLHVDNETQWSGDYVAAGVDTIGMYVKNFSNEDLDLRWFVFGENESSSVVPLAAGSDWTWVSFSLPGQWDNVTGVRLMHNPSLSIRGEEIAATIGVDDIEAIPEPVGLSLLGLGGILIRRRHILR